MKDGQIKAVDDLADDFLAATWENEQTHKLTNERTREWVNKLAGEHVVKYTYK